VCGWGAVARALERPFESFDAEPSPDRSQLCFNELVLRTPDMALHADEIIQPDYLAMPSEDLDVF
jgi:hypothetical protein